MATLVTFQDTDTGCTIGYIHVNDSKPTMQHIENVVNGRAFDSTGEDCNEDNPKVIHYLTAVGDPVEEGNTSMQLVRYSSNGWGSELLPNIGCLTFFKRHARTETPGSAFTIN